MNCIHCHTPIPQERIQFFAESGRTCTSCVKCSTEEKKIAFMTFDHKTGGYPVILPQKDGKTDPETVRLAKRQYFRER